MPRTPAVSHTTRPVSDYIAARNTGQAEAEAHNFCSTLTLRAYVQKHEEFLKWCKETLVDEPDESRSIVSGTKLLMFLTEQVCGRRHFNMPNSSNSQKKVRLTTICQYVAAAVDLYKSQKELGNNSNDHPRGHVTEIFSELAEEERINNQRDQESREQNTPTEKHHTNDGLEHVTTSRDDQQSIHEDQVYDNPPLSSVAPIIAREIRLLRKEMISQAETQKEAVNQMLAEMRRTLNMLQTRSFTLTFSLSPNPETEKSSGSGKDTELPSNPLQAIAPAINSAPPIVNNHSASTPVVYSMNRSIGTVPDLFAEFRTGYAGGPSIEHLEKTYGTEWRRDRSVNKFYSRRMAIIRAVKAYAKNKGVTEEQAIKRVEQWRYRLNKSRLVG